LAMSWLGVRGITNTLIHMELLPALQMVVSVLTIDMLAEKHQATMGIILDTIE